MSNEDEYTADTNPANTNSYLAITSIDADPHGIRVQWQGGVKAWQYLECIPYPAAVPLRLTPLGSR